MFRILKQPAFFYMAGKLVRAGRGGDVVVKNI